ncbi:MAG: hypothetical protein KF901_15240 [Myxococcales bacterium]|nr:hypothetical protein [Myxococcales bacterium]
MIRGMLGLGLMLGLACGFGCGGDDGPGDVDAGGGGTDSGGGEVDSGGGEVDAGDGMDAGTGMDAGSGMDAGTVDAGPILPDYDAGNPFGDAGTLGPPEWADLTIHTDGTECDALDPCGGNEVGTWDVSGGCVEVPVPADLMRCPGATISASGRARGRVVFDGEVAVRRAQAEIEASIFIPSICALFAGGCGAIEDGLRMASEMSRCVTTASSDCLCALRVVNVIDDGDAYTIEGNQIVSAALSKRWNYCVEGGELRYEDVSESGEREPGIIELTRRGE